MSSSQDNLFAGRDMGDASASSGREPSAREGNRLLRAQRKLEKKTARASRRGHGELQALLPKACSGRRANDCGAQIDYLLAHGEFMASGGRKRRVSERTLTIYGGVLRGAYEDLKKIGVPVWRVDSMNRKHVIELVRYWLALGHKPTTIKNKISNLRVFHRKLGRPEVIPEDQVWYRILSQNGIEVARLRHSSVASESKAWSAKGVDVWEVIRKVEQLDQIAAVQLMLELAFGLRVKETHCLNPFLCDLGTVLVIRPHGEGGSKGGRGRQIEFDQDQQVAAWQRSVLDKAKEIAALSPQRNLERPGRSLKQSIRRYYYVLEKCGVTQAGRGVTSHGLRYQFGHALYESVSGLPAPVLGQMPADVYRDNADAHAKAEQHVAEQKGHWWPSSARGYGGSPDKLAKTARKRLLKDLALFQDRQDVAAVFNEYGALEVWLCGRAAMGIPMREGEPLYIVMLVREPLTGEAEGACANALRRQIGRPIVISSTGNPNMRPPDSVEILLSHLPTNGPGTNASH